MSADLWAAADYAGANFDYDAPPGPAGGMLDQLRAYRTPWAGPVGAEDSDAGRDLRKERVRSGPGGIKFPWFLPYFDSEQSMSENAAMRMAYRKMLASPEVKAAFNSKLLAVAALDLKIIPASKKNPNHARHAEFIEWCLTDALEGGFPGLVWSVLSGGMIDGWSLCEKVWDREGMGDWQGSYYLRALKPKDTGRDVIPEVDEFRNVVSFKGLRYNAGESFHPANFVYYRHLPLWDTPTGVSDFRCIYGAWWMLDTAKKLRAMAIEKRTLPVIVGEYASSSQRPSLEEALGLVRSQSWLAVPAGAKVTALNIAGAADSIFDSTIAALKHDIFLGICGAVLQNLEGSVPAGRGNSETHRATADLQVWHLSTAIEALLNDRRRGLISDLMGLNFAADAYPRAALQSVDTDQQAQEMVIATGLHEMGVELSREALYDQFNQTPPDAENPADSLGGKADQEAQVAASTLMAPQGGAGVAGAADQVLVDSAKVRGVPPPPMGRATNRGGGQDSVTGSVGADTPGTDMAEGDDPPRDFGKAQTRRQAASYQQQHDQEQAAKQGPPAHEPEATPPQRPAARKLRGSQPLIPDEHFNLLEAVGRPGPYDHVAHAALPDWHEEQGDSQLAHEIRSMSPGDRSLHASRVKREEANRLAQELFGAGDAMDVRSRLVNPVERSGGPPKPMTLNQDDPEERRFGTWLSKVVAPEMIRWTKDPPEQDHAEDWNDHKGINAPTHEGVGVDSRGRRYTMAAGKRIPNPQRYDEGQPPLDQKTLPPDAAAVADTQRAQSPPPRHKLPPLPREHFDALAPEHIEDAQFLANPHHVHGDRPLHHAVIGNALINGHVAFYKGLPKEAGQREALIAKLHDLAGVASPAVKTGKPKGAPGPADGGFVAEYTDGPTLGDAVAGPGEFPDINSQRRSWARIEKTMPPGELDRAVAFSWLAGIGDRHAGNYIVAPDHTGNNRLHSVDHEYGLWNSDHEAGIQKMRPLTLDGLVQPPKEEGRVVGPNQLTLFRVDADRRHDFKFDPQALLEVSSKAGKVARHLDEAGEPEKARWVRLHGQALRTLARDKDTSVRRLGQILDKMKARGAR